MTTVGFFGRPRRVAVPAGATPGEVSLSPRTLKINGARYQADTGTLVVPEYRDDPA